MSFKEEARNRLAILRKWEDSTEYAQLCNELQQKKGLLIEVGVEFLNGRKNRTGQPLQVARIECAVGGNIHRGVYCPSPVYDIRLGGCHRGRILKRIAGTSKVTHRFGLSEDGELLYAENLQDGEVRSTEYFVVKDEKRYGITINGEGVLEAVSEEILQDGRIVQYTYAVLYLDENGYFCWNLLSEEYFYDLQGLRSCEVEDFQPYVNMCRKTHYEFERKDGLLSEYTCRYYPYCQESDNPSVVPRYRVAIKRKA